MEPTLRHDPCTPASTRLRWLLPPIVALLVLLPAVPREADAQAVLNPNQIAGTISFTNTNPAILHILEAGGLDEGFTHGYIRADSVDQSPALNNYTFPRAESRTSTPYELTVEAGVEGVVYDVTAEMRLDAGGERYLFGLTRADPLYPEPAPNATVDFHQCAGVLDVSWEDESGAPVQVQGGFIWAWKETFPGSGSLRVQAQDFSIERGTAREFLAVQGDGSRVRVEVTYEFGTDPYSNTVRHACEREVQVACDEIVPVVCTVPRGGALGQIAGTVDMLGEEEHRVRDLTRLHAFAGPLRNQRFDTIERAPSSGPFLLENLAPSDLESPARGYAVYSEMLVRSAYRAQYFRTPWLYGYHNGTVMVDAGQTTELADTFVVDPGFVSGEVQLAGPAMDAGTSCLSDVYRDADYDPYGDGVPLNTRISNSSVEAWGLDRLATGATKTAFGGLARAGFAGGFDAATGEFNGDFELALGGLHGQSSIWSADRLVLRFQDGGTAGVPETYQNSWVRIQDRIGPEHEIVPGGVARADHRYCMSEVNLAYHSLAGTFYAPRARATGGFVGSDFRGADVDYRSDVSYALGSPRSIAEASNRGTVTMCVPQGSYTLTPTVSAINPNGSTSTTELRPVRVDVGCRQVVSLTTDLQISLVEMPQCSTDAAYTIGGSVQSDGQVTRIFYTNNGGPEVDICTSCGVDPSFSAEIALRECDNEIRVSAVDEFGNESSVTTVLRKPRLDDQPPVISGVADISLALATGETAAQASWDLSATDNCDAEVSVKSDPPSGYFFAPGETTVHCEARDMCGNTSECSFVVSVAEFVEEPVAEEPAAEEPAEEEPAQDEPVEDPDADVCADDTVAPVVECFTDVPLLWSPNHDLVETGLAARTSDTCDEGVTESLITTIWSDESEVPGAGDGSGRHAADAKSSDDGLLLRSERNGTGDGRVYLSISTATDAAGNTGHACCVVIVPHDRSAGSLEAALAQATAAQAYCEEHGRAPASFHELGKSDPLGPMQELAHTGAHGGKSPEPKSGKTAKRKR